MRSDRLHGLRSYLLLVLLVAIGLCAGTAAAAAPLDLSNDTGTVPEYGTALSLAVLDRLTDDSITLKDRSNNTSVAVVRSSITDPGFYEIIPGVAGTAEIVFHDTTSGRTGTFILTVISDPAAVPPTVDAVRLSPETASASPGALVRFYARPVNTSSGPIPGMEVSWSDGSRTGTADAANDSCIDYRIPADAPAGPVSITCSCANGVEAVFSLEVVPHVLTDITLVSSRSVLSYIDSFTVTAVGNDGHVFDPGEILWEVGDTRLLVPDGSVSANSARFRTGTTDGVTAITASVAGGPSAVLPITVGVPPTPVPVDNGGADDGAELLERAGAGLGEPATVVPTPDETLPPVTRTTAPTVSPTPDESGDAATSVPGLTVITPDPTASATPSGGTPPAPASPTVPKETQGPVPLPGILAGLGAVVLLARRRV